MIMEIANSTYHCGTRQRNEIPQVLTEQGESVSRLPEAVLVDNSDAHLSTTPFKRPPSATRGDLCSLGASFSNSLAL